jgi:hypothetical protein
MPVLLVLRRLGAMSRSEPDRIRLGTCSMTRQFAAASRNGAMEAER